MTTLNSYHDLTEQGFNFWLEKGALKYRAPKGKMTADILAWLKTHKTELISLLATNDHYEKIVADKVSTITQTVTYTAIELLTRCEEPLFNHLLTCSICHVERGEYCLQGNERGKNYDDVLLPFDDAQAKRESLSLRVDKALISGRSIFGARK